MNAVMESILTVCLVLIVTELLQKFCPEDQMTRFVGSLAVLAVTLSAVGSLLSLDVELPISQESSLRQQEELASYVEEQVEQAAEEDLEAYVQGLLGTVGLQAKEIQVFTDRNEDGSIVLTEVAAAFQYSSQEEQARVLLQNVLGEDVVVSVTVEG